MSKKLPTHAQVVVIGGGVVGCSVAYHLTKLGHCFTSISFMLKLLLSIT